MDFYLAVVAGELRQAAENIERRHAGAPYTLASLRMGIAAAYQGLRDAWQTEIPADLLPGFLCPPAPNSGERVTWN
jgi:hypothetical protein